MMPLVPFKEEEEIPELSFSADGGHSKKAATTSQEESCPQELNEQAP